MWMVIWNGSCRQQKIRAENKYPTVLCNSQSTFGSVTANDTDAKKKKINVPFLKHACEQLMHIVDFKYACKKKKRK